ncbi:methionine--tRNA ligase [Planctomycetales bacterium]|nr:methionine--tRNA ligase [Planctomycetales bacterium]
MPPLKSRYLVTAALPYANGRAHVGHIAGCYLPADTFVRFLRLTGREAVFICGSDENGAPITFAALKEGVSPQDIVNRYHQILKTSFAGLGIDFSFYGETHAPAHDDATQKFFLKLLAGNYVQKRTVEQVYCRECQMFLPDRYIEGLCPFCGKSGARGDQCEACGRPTDATKLGEPECKVCPQQGRSGKNCVEVRASDHWFLQLNSSETAVRQYLDAHPEWRAAVKHFSYGLLDEGLRERCITRDLTWGVPVPLDGAAGKVLYVWFDAPIGYITFSQQYFAECGQPDGWRDFWQNADTGLVHFIGKDNTVFHSVMFPAMLMAHGGYRLPDTVVANEFLNLERDKISTSRQHAVWVDEYLTQFAPDSLRYYLTTIAPENHDSDFSWTGFQTRHNGELADNLGNFIQRNLAFCQKYFDGAVPAATASEAGQKLLAKIAAAKNAAAEKIGEHCYRDALDEVMMLSRAGNEFFSAETPWKTRTAEPEKCAATILTCVQTVEALSVLMAPFLPFSAAKLRATLNLPALQDGDWNAPGQIKGGHLINAPEVLFPKIDDAAITAAKERSGVKPV